MADALENRIQDALTERLRGIRKADGYRTDLGANILDTPEDEDAVDDSQKPCAFVLPGEEAADEGCNGGEYGSLFEMWVIVYARAPKDEINRLVSDLKADVKKNVLTDPSLGLGTVTNEVDWGGARRAIDVVDELSVGIGRAALRFVIGAEWRPATAA